MEPVQIRMKFLSFTARDFWYIEWVNAELLGDYKSYNFTNSIMWCYEKILCLYSEL